MSTKHVLSSTEKLLIVNASKYFDAEAAEGRTGSRTLTRERVAACLGFAVSTVAVVIAHWRKHQDPKFATPVVPRGHRPRSPAASFAIEIRTMTRRLIEAQQPITAKILVADLHEYTPWPYFRDVINCYKC